MDLILTYEYQEQILFNNQILCYSKWFLLSDFVHKKQVWRVAMMVHLLSTKCVLGISLDSCDASNFKRDGSPYHLGAYIPVEEIDKCNKYVHRTKA